jgi:hypothetical protein
MRAEDAGRAFDDLEGAEILDAVEDFLRVFIAHPNEHARVVHVLWIAHAHLMDFWESTPRIAFLSPEPASGKSRALEITELLVPRPVQAVNVSPAYLFRKVADEAGRPTILFDEIDTVFGPKARDNEEIRGLLNAGHRKGAVAGRCVVKAKTIETEEIEAYCAVAVAGLGSLPDTILSRAVVVRMRPRAPGENVEPYRRRLHRSRGEGLCERLADWLAGASPEWPDMPDGIADRDADVWEPLLAIADLAGGPWPNRARVAAVALVAASKESTPSLGVRLLADIRTAFCDDYQLPTATLVQRLCEPEEAPWGELRGKPIDARWLSRMLSKYGIGPATIRVGLATPKGYRRGDFNDAWTRYLPTAPALGGNSATTATIATVGAVSDGAMAKGRAA